MLWEFEYEKGRYLNTLDKEFFIIFFSKCMYQKIAKEFVVEHHVFFIKGR